MSCAEPAVMFRCSPFAASQAAWASAADKREFSVIYVPYLPHHKKGFDNEKVTSSYIRDGDRGVRRGRRRVHRCRGGPGDRRGLVGDRRGGGALRERLRHRRRRRRRRRGSRGEGAARA